MENNMTFLKTPVLFLSLVASSFALADDYVPSCNLTAQSAAVQENYRATGAESSGCGTQLLYKGDLTETFLVCVSDETEPSEWIVTIKTSFSKPTRVACEVEAISKANDSSAPSFP